MISIYLQLIYKNLYQIGMAVYHKEVLKQTIILGIYFMLTYTTFLSFSCIITYIAEHE